MTPKLRQCVRLLTRVYPIFLWLASWTTIACEAFLFVEQHQHHNRPTTRTVAVVVTRPLPTFTTTVLHSKKKKVVAPAAAKKIQVKMLQSVPGTGQKGDVVLVTPAFFNNKLRPTASAAIISTEQVEHDRAEHEAAEQERNAQAELIQQYLESHPLRFQRKAGPDGHLFGSINAKAVLTTLAEQVLEAEQAAFIGQKYVKIASLVDGEGKEMQGDIKHVGEFQATISLTQKVSANLSIIVVAE